MAFNTDISGAKDRLKATSFLHLEDVLSDEFVSQLKRCGEKIKEGSMPEVEEWHIPGKKRQYLYDFPSFSFLNAFREGIAQITGFAAKDIMIGERHIKVYLDEAPEFPAPHMDRRAAEFTIGFPITIPEASRVCFFPHLSREENTSERAVFAELPEETDMQAYYDDARIAQYRGKVGDMFIFHGSTIFHERIKPAGSVILYIKINASGRDPLGEHASMMASLEANIAA